LEPPRLRRLGVRRRLAALLLAVAGALRQAQQQGVRCPVVAP
jgi:hypothetical protein